MEDLLRVGVITKTHGIKGEVKLFPTSDDLDRYKVLKNVLFRASEKMLKSKLSMQKFFKQYVIIKFKRI